MNIDMTTEVLEELLILQILAQIVEATIINVHRLQIGFLLIGNLMTNVERILNLERRN